MPFIKAVLYVGWVNLPASSLKFGETGKLSKFPSER